MFSTCGLFFFLLVPCFVRKEELVSVVKLHTQCAKLVFSISEKCRSTVVSSQPSKLTSEIGRCKTDKKDNNLS